VLDGPEANFFLVQKVVKSSRMHFFAQQLSSKMVKTFFLLILFFLWRTPFFWPEFRQSYRFLDEKYHLAIFFVKFNGFLNLVNFKLLEWQPCWNPRNHVVIECSCKLKAESSS